MNDPASIAFVGDCMSVVGEIDFVSVVDLERQGEAWLRGQAPPKCRVNLSAVSRSNSAGTALLISWLRTAAAVGKNLQLEQLPRSLAALIHLGGLDDVLPTFDTVWLDGGHDCE